MPAPSSLPQTYGSVNGSPIQGYSNPALWVLMWVTLTANYARKTPPGYPVPPYPGPETASLTAFPQTIPSGTRLQLFADEVAALVQAGAAVYS